MGISIFPRTSPSGGAGRGGATDVTVTGTDVGTESAGVVDALELPTTALSSPFDASSSICWNWCSSRFWAWASRIPVPQSW